MNLEMAQASVAPIVLANDTTTVPVTRPKKRPGRKVISMPLEMTGSDNMYLILHSRNNCKTVFLVKFLKNGAGILLY